MLLMIYGPNHSGKNELVKLLVETKNFKKLDFSLNMYNIIVKLGQWKTDYVTILPNITDWLIFKKRPCARLVVIFAPCNSHWRKENDDAFISKIALYEDAYKIANFGQIEDLKRVIDQCLVTVRPSWDNYFMSIAVNVSMRSNCMKGKVGCVVVKDNRILSTGYNGTPSNMTNCYENGCKRCNSGAQNAVDLEYCLCIHAEENSLLFLGTEQAKDSILYVTRFPCILCCRKIVQMRVKGVVYLTEYGLTDDNVYKLLTSANINVKKLQI